MKKILFFLIFTLYLQADYAYFTPPDGWEMLEEKTLPKTVCVGFIKKIENGLSPSLNLASEKISCSENEYLKIVKKLHSQDKKNRFRDLGSFQTEAGKAHLYEVVIPKKEGEVKLLQLIFVKEETAYVLTAGAIKQEISKYYVDFKNAFSSFSIAPDFSSELEEMRRSSKEDLQKTIATKYRDKGSYFQLLLLKELVKENNQPDQGEL